MTSISGYGERLQEVELALAGEILYKGGDVLTEVRDRVPPEAFQSSLCRGVYQAACSAQDKGRDVEASTVREEISALKLEIPESFCNELSYYAVTAANVAAQCQVLLNAYSTRKLRDVLSDTLLNLPVVANAEEVIAELEAKFRNIAGESNSVIIEAGETASDIGMLRSRLEEGEYSAYVPTGYPSLDEAFGGGLKRGGLYIVAARPGVGKTALALGIAERVCAGNRRILIVSMEMKPEELTARYLAMKTGIGSTRILVQPHLERREISALVEELNRLSENGPMYNRRHSATVSDIGFMARRAEAELLIIDYLGLIRPTEGRGRYEQTTVISNQLKVLAMDLNIPILCLAQLNRQTQSIHDEPKLSDLRDSGAIEQDADGVLLLYRPTEDDPDGSTVLAATVAKNRHGKGGGHVEFLYKPMTNKIVEMQQPAAYTCTDADIPF